jgi:hypothetical protein
MEDFNRLLFVTSMNKKPPGMSDAKVHSQWNYWAWNLNVMKAGIQSPTCLFARA